MSETEFSVLWKLGSIACSIALFVGVIAISELVLYVWPRPAVRIHQEDDE